ncbi:B-block binding subunit of TFIIIC [Cynara cardunculus var. scolymus]|uniref:B-block binding subunit of TFIIIC n=1 Tax=Cynara cardunculus var. scolymus TaxID=59895 RepID=A0A103XVZ2_CYNCS|nr:B-block binding subunit of TFIIIC [Cynara cardunculus var. scolymus]
MDAVVIGALEEICLEGIKGLFYSQRIEGLTLHDLWPKIHSYLSSNHLPLCKNVKKVLWSNLLSIPSLHFECNDGDPKIQSFEDSERMELKILPAEHLLKSFVGVYDHEDVPQQYRRVLNRIAIARTDGVTQNDLAKELGIENKSIFYTVKKLESRGLIVRQSTLIRNKEFGHEGEYKNGSTVNTNMLYLYRYAKHLGSLQRLEITKEDKAFIDGDPEEGVKEDVHIKDYEPALKAICDKLEKANDKKVICLRLLNKFSPKSYAPSISCGGGHNDLATEQQVKPAKRGQITEQLMELPIERQIYDMIDAEEYDKRNRAMVSKYGMHLESERLNRGQVNRAWTSRNLKIEVSNTLRGKLEDTVDKKYSNHAKVGQLQLAHTNLDSDHLTSKVDGKGEKFDPVKSLAIGRSDTPLDSRSLYIRQCDGNGISSDAELQMANVKPAEKVVSLETSSSAKPAPQSRRLGSNG